MAQMQALSLTSERGDPFCYGSVFRFYEILKITQNLYKIKIRNTPRLVKTLSFKTPQIAQQ